MLSVSLGRLLPGFGTKMLSSVFFVENSTENRRRELAFRY